MARRGGKKGTGGVSGRVERRRAASSRMGRGELRKATRQPARKAGRLAGPPKAKATKSVKSATKTVGYAVVGLGHIAQAAVLPAFKNANNAQLVALVSSNEEKRTKLGRRYKVKHQYGYDDFDACLQNPEVDAVYIALPNDQHHDYAVRAARAGKHVLCEKPMELTEEKCEAMIRACDEAGVKLMIAYRLHFEAANLHAIDLVQRGKIGEPKFFSSNFSYQVKADDIRTKEERGGGATWDIGVYCVNATRYLFRAEPLEVFAWSTKGEDERFSETEESLACVMKFPGDKVATFNVSFGSAPTDTWHLVGTEGHLRLDAAYDYVGDKTLTVTIDEKSKEKRFKPTDQFGPELEYFARCVLDGMIPEPDGWEGLADVRVIRAIYESARVGRPIAVEPVERTARPDESQLIEKPAIEEPPLVNEESPSH